MSRHFCDFAKTLSAFHSGQINTTGIYYLASTLVAIVAGQCANLKDVAHKPTPSTPFAVPVHRDMHGETIQCPLHFSSRLGTCNGCITYAADKMYTTSSAVETLDTPDTLLPYSRITLGTINLNGFLEPHPPTKMNGVLLSAPSDYRTVHSIHGQIRIGKLAWRQHNHL